MALTAAGKMFRTPHPVFSYCTQDLGAQIKELGTGIKDLGTQVNDLPTHIDDLGTQIIDLGTQVTANIAQHNYF